MIELLLVIVVMSVFTAGIIMFINPLKRINQAKDARIKNNIDEISLALKSYYSLMGLIYPQRLDDLVSNQDIKSLPKTPGGSDYSYLRSDTCNYYTCEAVVYTALYNPTDGGNVWCWRSTSGTATETSEVLCRP